MGVDVWYSYVAPCNGTATFSFCQGGGTASFDTVLAAFTGTCGSLTQIACNDDFCATASEMTFAATSGTQYHIAVGGWVSTVTGPRQGTFTMFVDCQ
jgi:hypothetical protein